MTHPYDKRMCETIHDLFQMLVTSVGPNDFSSRVWSLASCVYQQTASGSIYSSRSRRSTERSARDSATYRNIPIKRRKRRVSKKMAHRIIFAKNIHMVKCKKLIAKSNVFWRLTREAGDSSHCRCCNFLFVPLSANFTVSDSLWPAQTRGT